MNFISVQNIFFSYSNNEDGSLAKNAVNGVSLEIKKGEFSGITAAESQQ